MQDIKKYSLPHMSVDTWNGPITDIVDEGSVNKMKAYIAYIGWETRLTNIELWSNIPQIGKLQMPLSSTYRTFEQWCS